MQSDWIDRPHQRLRLGDMPLESGAILARTARWSQLVNEMARRALFADADCRVPRPRGEAMRLWTPLTQLVMSRTPEALDNGFATVEGLYDCLDARAAALAADGPDPFDWCCQSRAYDAHDVAMTPGGDGDMDRTLARIRAQVLILAPRLDLYNPVSSARAAAAGIPDARFVELPGDDGHQSASGVSQASTALLRQAIRSFLAEGPG